jgi:hypothetical protein
MDTCPGWGLTPPLLISSSLIATTDTYSSDAYKVSVLRRWYAERDPLAFAKVKALRRRGADSV